MIQQQALQHLVSRMESLEVEMTQLAFEASPSCRALAARLLPKCKDDCGDLLPWAVTLLQNLRQDKDTQVLQESWSFFF